MKENKGSVIHRRKLVCSEYMPEPMPSIDSCCFETFANYLDTTTDSFNAMKGFLNTYFNKSGMRKM